MKKKIKRRKTLRNAYFTSLDIFDYNRKYAYKPEAHKVYR